MNIEQLRKLAESKGLLLDIDGRSMMILKPLYQPDGDTVEVAHIRKTIGKTDIWQRKMIQVILETF